MNIVLKRLAAAFSVLLTLGVIAVIAAFAAGRYRLFSIPTGSMEETILLGDRIVMGPLNTETPSRGDIVVFRYPVDETQLFDKRVIGIPGDRIRIVNKQVMLNGVAAKEPYVFHKDDYMDSYRDNFPSGANIHLEAGGLDMLRNHVVSGEVVVPPQMFFVMGDNRDGSLDSRFWGFVPLKNVMGKTWFVLMSADPDTGSMRWDRLFLRLR